MKTFASSPCSRSARARGFTLIEVAIALVLLGLASGTVVLVLRQQLVQRQMAETDAILAQSNEALLAFVTSNGRLPCPATAATRGVESIATKTGNVWTCTSEIGFLPAVTLGMANLDSWGLLEGAWHDASGSTNGTYLRAIRYSVASLAPTGVAGALTSPALGGLPGNPTQRLAVQNAITSNNGLFVCYSSSGILLVGNRCGPAVTNLLAPNVAAIVWSLGFDAPSLAQYSADENQNLNPGTTRVIISHTYTPLGQAGGPFDDQVTWIPYSAVADRLVYAGYVQ